MSKITRHSKERIIERTENVSNFAEAKKLAKQAKVSGSTIDKYQNYPKFFEYLRHKRNQTRSCSVRVYRGNIYIWRGNWNLVTAHPIPERYLKEMDGVNE